MTGINKRQANACTLNSRASREDEQNASLGNTSRNGTSDCQESSTNSQPRSQTENNGSNIGSNGDSFTNGKGSTTCEEIDSNESIYGMFHQTNTLTMTCTSSGTISALVYWFDQKLASGIQASTVDPSMNFHQAAFILNQESKQVEEGETITLHATLEKSYLHFSLD